LILIIGALAIGGPYLTGKVFAWTLQVELTNKPFGDSGASVQVNGPDGYVDTKWFDWAGIRSGPTSGTATMNVPESGVPDNSPYTVCVSSKQLNALLAPFCYHANHGSGDEHISVALN
jgi:hypothetical protein